MSEPAGPDETTVLFTEDDLAFSDRAEDLPIEDDDAEFQPRQPRRLHWLTRLLLGLVIWGAGFLVGVLADRAVAGLVG